MSLNRLRVSGLCKAFETSTGARLEVLRGASLSVSEGEAVAIVGASGSGKSTLLHILGGLQAADSGEVRFGEFDLVRAGSAELARFRSGSTGFIFQFHHLLPDLTAAENVSLPLLISRRPRAESMERAVAMLERVGLRERVHQGVGQLSGGEQQRVALARALVTRPRLVLADEPTGNLDTSLGRDVGAILFAYARTERAVVIIATHNEWLARLCDRMLVLRDGLLLDVTGQDED